MAIRVKNRLMPLDSPIAMGILNVTPDSFFDGGMYLSDTQIVEKVGQMLSEGAAIIDVGAMSTRPGAQEVPAEEEMHRIDRALSLISNEFPDAVVSVDTWRADVAERALNAGAALINDISGGTFDARMAEVVGRYHVPCVLMHTTAKPDAMQQHTLGENPIAEILQFFGNQIDIFKKAGCNDLIIDPGFGFGKTLEQNYLLMENLQAFQIFGMPVLVGISRKSMIYKLLGTSPDEALAGTIALNMAALMNGASILRVHDVREAVETIRIYNQLKIKQISRR